MMKNISNYLLIGVVVVGVILLLGFVSIFRECRWQL
jgi:hypothetical protein